MVIKSLVPQQILVGNRILPALQPVLPVSDRGFLYGDAVYETLRAYQGIPFLIDEHLQRLRRSAAALYLELPWPDAELKSRLDRLLAVNQIEAGRIRITVTRGSGDVRARQTEMREPTLVMTAEPMPVGVAEAAPVAVEIASRFRNLPAALDPAIKSANFLNNILARFEMKDPAAFEVLLPNQAGELTEGSLSNLFIVDEAGGLLTPASESGLLPGITRDLVMTLAGREGIEAGEARMMPEQLLGASEAFLTASTIEILPIAGVEGNPFAGSAPGPVTARLQVLYREAVASYLLR
jgi:branched-chain amino acid aminotransferase